VKWGKKADRSERMKAIDREFQVAEMALGALKDALALIPDCSAPKIYLSPI
jgi:hypothetical protein